MSMTKGTPASSQIIFLEGRVAEQDAEIERLRVENIQMQAALGYAICAEDERHIIPSNPYSCGVCDARKRSELQNHGQVEKLSEEITRLRAALQECAAVVVTHHAEDVSRTNWSGSGMAQKKARAVATRSGLLMHKVMTITRAALEERT